MTSEFAFKVRFVPATSVPEPKVRVPAKDAAELIVSPAELLRETLLNELLADPEMVWAVVPPNATVPDPGVKVPLFVQLPLIVIVCVPVISREAPLSMVIFLATAPVVLITGLKGATAGICTSVVEVGRTPLHQLAVLNQSVEVPPIQYPLTQTKVLVVTFRIPVAVVPKKVEFLYRAVEAVLP
jgi:hypothetical protein